MTAIISRTKRIDRDGHVAWPPRPGEPGRMDAPDVAWRDGAQGWFAGGNPLPYREHGPSVLAPGGGFQWWRSQTVIRATLGGESP
jgi:hypothetical protein